MTDSPIENSSARESSGRLNVLRTLPALFLLVAIILFCRQPNAVIHPSLFAEDGNIFFKQQYEQGFASALRTHYNGNLQFAPRVIAAVCAMFPLEYVPVAYAVASLLIAAAALTFFFAPGFRSVIADDRLRAIVVVIFTLMPNAEPLMKLSYLSWYMLFITAQLCFFTLPKNFAVRWLSLTLFVPIACASPVAIVCLPVLFMRAWFASERGEKVWWMLLALTIVGFSFTAERVPAVMTTLLRESSWRWSLLHALGYRVFWFFFLGSTLSYPTPWLGWLIVTLVSLVMAGICFLAAFREARTKSSTKARWHSVILLYLILTLPALFVLRKEWWGNFLSWNLDAWLGSDRYFFSSTLLLCVFSGMIYERIVREWLEKSSRRRQFSRLVLFCWLGLHALGFELHAWHTTTEWRQFAPQIRAAEIRSQQTGSSETLHFQNGVADFDFDLVVKPR